MYRHIIAAAICTFAASAAQAQIISEPQYGLSLGASTLGLTAEPSVRLNDHWGLRAPIGAGSFDFDDESNGEDYSGDVDIGGIGLLADWYPQAGNGFRLSAGAFYTNYKADLVADGISLNGIVTDVDAHVRQDKRFLPALAVGYDGTFGQRGMFSFTLGGMFGNEFDVTARESTGLVPQDIVDAEVADIRDELEDYDVIPYIQIAIGFRF